MKADRAEWRRGIAPRWEKQSGQGQDDGLAPGGRAMRHIWAGTLGLSLSLGALSVVAQQPSTRAPAATLGRPVPAATLGLPVAADEYAEPLQPAGYINRAQPVAIAPGDSSMPLL